MYNITRQQASEILWVSTRSIDRYIKNWKIRTQKQWRQIMLHSWDVKNLSWDSVVNHKIIIEDKTIKIPNSIEKKEQDTSKIIRKSDYEKVIATFEKMYSSFREEVKQKDKKIQELSLEVWMLREQKNNSVDLMEYKKVQFLSEENKAKMMKKLEEQKKQAEDLEKKLKYEKTTNIFLIIFLVILFIISLALFFLNI